MGATLQEAFGARFRFGVARGLPALLKSQGLPHLNSKDFEEYCRIVRRLWDGETVEHDGPLGHLPAARLLLGSELTVEATQDIVGRLRRACEEIGRDPATLRTYMTVIAAPGLSEEEGLAVVDARIISHLGFGGVGKLIVRANG